MLTYRPHYIKLSNTTLELAILYYILCHELIRGRNHSTLTQNEEKRNTCEYLNTYKHQQATRPTKNAEKNTTCTQIRCSGPKPIDERHQPKLRGLGLVESVKNVICVKLLNVTSHEPSPHRSIRKHSAAFIKTQQKLSTDDPSTSQYSTCTTHRL